MSMALRPSTVLLLFRFAAGGCGRTTGAVARSAAKGGRPRRKSGLLFVYSSHGGHRPSIGGALAHVARHTGDAGAGSEAVRVDPRAVRIVAAACASGRVRTAHAVDLNRNE